MQMFNKVVWREGMFLMPQHFQQQDRYIEDQLKHHQQMSHPYYYGIHDIKINTDFLKQGKFILEKAIAVFQDGTYYQAPMLDALPEPLELASGLRDVTVYLALPDRRMVHNLSVDNAKYVRHQYEVTETKDIYLDDAGNTQIEVAHVRPFLLTDQNDLSQFCVIPLAKVKEVRPDKKVYLDQAFIEPRISINHHKDLMSYLEEIYGLLTYRTEILSKRLMHAEQSESAMVSDFMMLQLLNSNLVKCQHMLALPLIHTERVYEYFVDLLAQLSTYTSETRTFEAIAKYDHDHVFETFNPLMAALRKNLSMVLEQHAKSIALNDHQNGLFSAENIAENIFEDGSLIIGIYANKNQDALRASLVNQLKIGVLSNIKDIVSKGIQGIGIQSLPTAPRQIPYHANYLYFEIDMQNPMWEEVVASNSLCLHLASQLEDLRIELWSIR